VELSDIIFAVDSVPAVLAITRDPFIAYSSNAFAILGLRSLYFALAHILPRFRYIHQGLAVVLAFVGTKMLLSEKLTIPNGISLAVICGILGIAALASRIAPPAKSKTK
jgi:tellurite resistance protein TerC